MKAFFAIFALLFLASAAALGALCVERARQIDALSRFRRQLKRGESVIQVLEDAAANAADVTLERDEKANGQSARGR